MGVALALKKEDDIKEPNLQLVADLVAEQVNKTVQYNIEQMRQRNRAENLRLHGCDCPAARCYVSCPRYLTHYASQAEFWDWWGKTSPPDFREKEVMPPGEPTFKSRSRSRKKRQKKKLEEFTTRYFYLNDKK